MKPQVYLVGAGPGDPDLITAKGIAAIQKADVIVYDYLAAPELLDHAREEAELINAGKKGGCHTLSQQEINRLIVEKALAGHTVARLKGGDPFVFGRGGEEIEELIEAGVSFAIVPGVSSAIAAPAYAGIPLTHRRFASSVTFITGHEDPEKETSRINWQSLARGGGTLVFLMGVKNLPRITAKLAANGMDAQTPVALVRWGTTASQQTVSGTLATIVDNVQAAGLQPPCVIVVGGVAGLRGKMQWFENRPLFGRSIIITRARKQASDMVSRLSALGARCLQYPAIKIVPPEDFSPLDRAIAELESYDWLVFTSVNGVDMFFRRLFANNKDVRALGRIRTACIGPATAERLFGFGITSDIIPESYHAESVIEAFADVSVQDRRVLLPRAAEARPVLPVELGRMGARVNEVTAYHTIQQQQGQQELIAALAEKTVDMVTFTSSSTVRNFKALLPQERFEELIRGVAVAAIGPITADTAKENGFPVDLVAAEYTIPGLCEAIEEFFRP
ncbi:MAG TPA: uroporphyrinogen-III C-methyltransferase [Desulfosalsimonadaceae bacterium]|nr:uroporphyrinogen-III C-methyltransferase [Desulfosalsimonadaceae bacterium]